MSCLGLKWETEADTVRLGLNQMCLKKKLKGQKAAPERDVTSKEGLRCALKDGLISRAGILSRVAEMYDPEGC